MKAILEFDLPDDAGEHDRAVHALDWYLAVYDIVQELRRRVKYGDAGPEVQDLQEWVWGMLNDRGLDPERE